jgi:hypothetical protein
MVLLLYRDDLAVDATKVKSGKRALRGHVAYVNDT